MAASRSFNRKQALEKEIKELYANISIGSSGAPTIVSALGIASITRNGAGDYSIVLSDSYVSFKFFEGVLLSTSGEDINFQMHSEAVSSTKEVRFLTIAGSTKTDPSNGAKLHLRIVVKNTAMV
jgi:hypothetical protein